jgi:hypothetical protein
MSSTKIYQLSKMKQLIDLNGEKVNFNLNFEARSKDKKPFQAIVINQKALDSDEKIEYKEVEDGEITGNIISDKNVYQSYFLILKAKEPCECEVTIDIEEIEPKTDEVEEKFIQEPSKTRKKKDENNWVRNIFIFIGVCLLIYVGYWIYCNYFCGSKVKLDSGQQLLQSTYNDLAEQVSPIIQQPITTSPVLQQAIVEPVNIGVSESLKIPEPVINNIPNTKSVLADKIKNLAIW